MSGNRLSSVSQIPSCFVTVNTKTTATAASPISLAEGTSSLRELSAMQPASTTALQAWAIQKGRDGDLVS